MMMATPRRRRAVYVSCTALIATVSLFAFAQNTTAPPTRPTRARLVLLSAPRSGSTLLVEMLRTHGDVLMHGEPFHEQDLRTSRKDGLAHNVTVDNAAFRRRRERPQDLLEALAAKHTNRKVVGFKLFSKHLDWTKLDTFLEWADHLILLRRDDAFAQYVSICLAQASDVWQAWRGAQKHDHLISVDPTLYATWAKHERTFVDTVEQALKASTRPPDVLHLTYERDLCAPRARRNTLRRVEKFLGLAPGWRADAAHLPVKQHAVDVRDHVSNFGSVARVLPAANASKPCVEERRRLDVRRDVAGVDWLGSTPPELIDPARAKAHAAAKALMRSPHCKEGGAGWL